MNDESRINEKLKYASSCPFLNMIRAFDGIDVNEKGNAERYRIRDRMRFYGFGALSTVIIDRVTAGFEKGQVPEGWLNLTTIFNHGPMNHYAAMNAVDREAGRVDVPQIQKIVADLEGFSDRGIIDVVALAKLQRVIYARDRDKVLRFRTEAAKISGIKEFFSEFFAMLNRLFYAKVVSAGELSLIMLMFGYRDRLTRARFIHTQQWGNFLANGQLPHEYQKENCNIFGVLCLIQLIFLLQVVMHLPGEGLRKVIISTLMCGYNVFCAVGNRLRQLIETPLGLWVSAKRATRDEVREWVQ